MFHNSGKAVVNRSTCLLQCSTYSTEATVPFTKTELCVQGDFFYQLQENYTDRMTPYGILFTHNVFPLQAL